MGAAVSAARDMVDQSDKALKEKVQQQLDFLVNAANSKLDHYQNEMEDMFTDPATVEKKMIPGIRAMRWDRGYRVGVEKNTAGGGLSNIVDNFFGIASDAVGGPGKTQPKNQAIIAGFKNIVGNALTSILGNTSAGEQEEQKFFVFMEHNAIIRIDVRIWKYNFSSSGIMANAENVFCYIFCTSVVNSATVKLDELTYLLSEYAGDDDVEAYVEKILNIWTSVHKMHLFIQQNSLQNMAIQGGKAQLALPAPSGRLEEEQPVRKALTSG